MIEIYNASGQVIHRSRNLRGIFDHCAAHPGLRKPPPALHLGARASFGCPSVMVARARLSSPTLPCCAGGCAAAARGLARAASPAATCFRRLPCPPTTSTDWSLSGLAEAAASPSVTCRCDAVPYPHRLGSVTAATATWSAAMAGPCTATPTTLNAARLRPGRTRRPTLRPLA